MLFEPRLSNVVVPIVRALRRDGGYFIEGALGTGFPIRDKHNKLFLVTAAHVLRQCPDGQIPCALFSNKTLELKTYPISEPRFDDATDLASCLLSIDPKSGVVVCPFGITAENTEQTRTVFVHEFSYTRPARGVEGTELTFHPITHKGNVVGQIAGVKLSNTTEPIGIYWLSEQMFEGASGAPVLRAPDMAIAGVVLGNQVELDPTAYLSGEERIKRGFGVAVQASVVRLALGRMGIEPVYLP